MTEDSGGSDTTESRAHNERGRREQHKQSSGKVVGLGSVRVHAETDAGATILTSCLSLESSGCCVVALSVPRERLISHTARRSPLRAVVPCPAERETSNDNGGGGRQEC